MSKVNRALTNYLLYTKYYYCKKANNAIWQFKKIDHILGSAKLIGNNIYPNKKINDTKFTLIRFASFSII